MDMFHHGFDHSPESKEVGELLLMLRQGPRRVSEFALEIHTISAGSRWNNAMLKATFRQGLNPEILMEMACHDEPLTLHTLIELAVQLDHLLPAALEK